MKNNEKITKAQALLLDQGIDGWLLYDFRRTNDLACTFLGIPPHALTTRRFFYWIPAQGKPMKLLNKIEDKTLDHLPGEKRLYATWQELHATLHEILKDKGQVAMEFSPLNALPYASKVDAGTVDLVRTFGIQVVASANLLIHFTGKWSPEQLKSHLYAADLLDTIAGEVWEKLRGSLKSGSYLSELDIQEFMITRIRATGCTTADLPICAVNAHSADPHYSPEGREKTLIKPGDFVLIDLWCKQEKEGAVYGDITRVAVAGAPTELQQQVFDLVRQAQRAGTQLVEERFSRGSPLRGWEVDQACRDVISEGGFGEFFIHRTGHNIDTNDHGSGTHMDNYETHDDRPVLPGTCFSIEPGIYLPGKFGVRLEYDVYIHHDGKVQVTGGSQDSLVVLS